MTDDQARLNAVVAQFESASYSAFMRRPRSELDALARDLGHPTPHYMNKPELVGWIKAKI